MCHAVFSCWWWGECTRAGHWIKSIQSASWSYVFYKNLKVIVRQQCLGEICSRLRLKGRLITIILWEISRTPSRTRLKDSPFRQELENLMVENSIFTVTARLQARSPQGCRFIRNFHSCRDGLSLLTSILKYHFFYFTWPVLIVPSHYCEYF